MCFSWEKKKSRHCHTIKLKWDEDEAEARRFDKNTRHLKINNYTIVQWHTNGKKGSNKTPKCSTRTSNSKTASLSLRPCVLSCIMTNTCIGIIWISSLKNILHTRQHCTHLATANRYDAVDVQCARQSQRYIRKWTIQQKNDESEL